MTKVDSLKIEAQDGLGLAATRYLPATPVGVLVVIAPATGVARGYYRPFAEYLAGRGLEAVTFDYRGIGDSPLASSPRDVRMRDWGERDVAGILEWALRERPSARLLVVGHSAGGQLVGLAPAAARVTALLGVAAQSGYYGHWSPLGRLALLTLWRAVLPPVTAALGYFPGWLFGSRIDLPGGVAREWASWCLHPKYLHGHVEDSARAGYREFRGRLLGYAFSDDPYAPPAAVRAFLHFYPSGQATMREIRPADAGVRKIGHFGFFRPVHRHTLWVDAADWLLADRA